MVIVPTYAFKITKGKYQLSLSTTDKELVDSQFALWVRKASEYVKNNKIRDCKDIVTSQINTEKEITQRKIDEQLQRMPKHEPVEEAPIVNKEDIKNNIDKLYIPQEEAKLPEEANEGVNQGGSQAPENVGFDNILDRSMHTPQEEMSFKPNPSIKKDNAFLNYMNGRNVERKVDYLLLTAYYVTQFEQKPRFTLKQLKAKLMQNLAVMIDHSVLQEAINRDYIECLPDLTGVVGASEYRLTAYGEKNIMEM